MLCVCAAAWALWARTMPDSEPRAGGLRRESVTRRDIQVACGRRRGEKTGAHDFAGNAMSRATGALRRPLSASRVSRIHEGIRDSEY